MVRIYAAGDYLPMFARVASLQAYLASKEVVGRTAPELARIGALEALASLCLTNGQQLGSSIAETAASAIKLVARCARIWSQIPGIWDELQLPGLRV